MTALAFLLTFAAGFLSGFAAFVYVALHIDTGSRKRGNT